MKITMIKTSACTTTYCIEESGIVKTVDLWAIVGGQLALRLNEAPYDMSRFNINSLFKCENWLYSEKRYRHQDKKNIIGPQISDLDSGQATFESFILRALTLQERYNKRKREIDSLLGHQIFTLKSRRYHDVSNHFYYHLKLDLIYGYTYRIHNITKNASCSSGFLSNEDIGIVDECWLEADKIIKLIKKENSQALKIHEINEKQFARYLQAIKLVVSSPKTALEKKTTLKNFGNAILLKYN